jgi:hypothetical protein
MKRLLGLTAALVTGVLAMSGYGSAAPASASGYQHCPKWNPIESITAESEGTKGQAAPAGPSSALVCRWQEVAGHYERAERLVRSRPALTAIVRALDALGPKHEIKGMHSCEEALPQSYFIVLHYGSEEDVPIAAEYESCRYVVNAVQGSTYEVSERLSRVLDRVLPAVRTRSNR